MVIVIDQKAKYWGDKSYCVKESYTNIKPCTNAKFFHPLYELRDFINLLVLDFLVEFFK